MVWLPRNEKQTHRLNSRPQMWPMGLNLTIILTFEFWRSNVTLTFDHTDDLDHGFSWSNFEIVVSQNGRADWHCTKEVAVGHSWPWSWPFVWPRSGVWIYQVVTGVTLVVGLPSTHLVHIWFIFGFQTKLPISSSIFFLRSLQQIFWSFCYINNKQYCVVSIVLFQFAGCWVCLFMLSTTLVPGVMLAVVPSTVMSTIIFLQQKGHALTGCYCKIDSLTYSGFGGLPKYSRLLVLSSIFSNSRTPVAPFTNMV